jgi:hypothetical protein
MSPSIRERLLHAEENLLAASDEPLMEEFQRTWRALTDDILEAANTCQMSQEDLALADIVSSRIAFSCESFENLAKACDTISNSFERNLQKILEEHEHPFELSSSSEISQAQPTTAPYIRQAYAWLKSNLSNPHPSKEVREAIAHDTGSDPKHIENWFGDVRKRIGWNGIRRRYFSNKRRLVVEASTAFFSNQPSDLLTDSVRQDFAAMSAAAGELYAGKLDPSKLAKYTEEISSRLPHNDGNLSPLRRHTSTETVSSQDRAFSQCVDSQRKRRRSLSPTSHSADVDDCRKRARFFFLVVLSISC